MEEYKHKSFSIDFGTIKGNILVCLNNDFGDACDREIAAIKEENEKGCEGWIEFLESIKPELSESKNAAGSVKQLEINGVLYYALFMRPFDMMNTLHHTILAHECLHLCQFHLPKFFNRNREIEFEAYTHTHLMQQFYENAL